MTIGALEQAKYILGFPARLGHADGFIGLTDEIDSPAFATVAGLIFYGARQGSGDKEMSLPNLTKGLPIKAVSQKSARLY